ncbi:ADP-ribosylation factor-like protein 10 isoform X1 [Caloenas nicobarica]|uniref:ADP-ribosylation factor-like protein 10 isoform X1 n=1 Tax=Caloenas nicobarica TaxID=187106 RepID=UPI0032B79C35
MALAGALRDLTLALGAAVAALGSLLFIAWKIYFRTGTGTDWSGWWERELRELRDRAPAGDALDWRQVLVLGLDGAGKSSVLHYICSQTARERIAPTHGFNSAQIYVGGLEMDLLEGKAGLAPTCPPELSLHGLEGVPSPPALGWGCRATWAAGASWAVGALVPRGATGRWQPRSPPRRCLILPLSCSGGQPEPASVLAPLSEPGPRAGVCGRLGGQVTPADGAPGAACTAGCRAPAAPGRAGQQAGQEQCPEHGRAVGGASPAHTQRAAGALPPAHQRDLGQPELCHQRPPREEPAGHPALPALRPYGGRTGSHPQHSSSLGSTALGWRWPSRRPGAQTRW